MKKLNLLQVADRVSMHGYVLSTEGSDLSAEDLVAIASDLEQAVQALLDRAKENA